MSTAVSQGAVPATLLDFDPVTPLKAKRGHHVATLHLRSHKHGTLDLYTQFALQAARSLKLPTSGAASLPTTRELVTVIKSHFVHKKSQENFESRTHRRAIKVYDADRDALDLWLRYLKKNSIGGVGMKAYIHEYVEYGFAAGELKEVESMLSGPENEVEKAAAEIVKALGGAEFEKEVKKVEEVKAEVKEEVKEEVKVEAEAEVKAEAEAAKEEVAEAKAEEPAPAEEAKPVEPKA
jgi:small subunit ribosomal protein S10